MCVYILSGWQQLVASHMAAHTGQPAQVRVVLMMC